MGILTIAEIRVAPKILKQGKFAFFIEHPSLVVVNFADFVVQNHCLGAKTDMEP
jgi:hypothetical protein